MSKTAIKPDVLDRLVYLVSPAAGAKRYAAKLRKTVMTSSGYGKHGASSTLSSLAGWLPGGGSAEDDVDLNAAQLRIRARDLYAGGGLARSGICTLTTNVTGWGIQPKPKIDGEKLHLTDEECDRWERNTLREFKLWAESRMCDAERSKDFYTLQQLAFRNMLMSGDVFVLFGMKPNPQTPYCTTLRLIEADRVSTPDSSGYESVVLELPSGHRVTDGVETDGEGAVVAYHIASRHPLAMENSATVEWTQIPAYGAQTGQPNILHVCSFERPEQRRGVPFVSAQVEQIKQLDRYITSELAANVVAAMLTAFLESDSDDGKFGMEDAVNEEDRVTDDDLNIELRPGAIYKLPPGNHVTQVNPIRNNSAFESFVTAMETVIGASMEIPKEVLTKKYDSNYTAARSALLDFWKTVRVMRTAFNARFNQPVYELFLSEAVAQGRVSAPGFFDDPAVKKAWCGCLWMGASMGHVDPLKEVKAARERIDLNISTQEQEAGEYNGNDWVANVRQRKKEISELNSIQQAIEKVEPTESEETDE